MKGVFMERCVCGNATYHITLLHSGLTYACCECKRETTWWAEA